jgi:hypothetical protein
MQAIADGHIADGKTILLLQHAWIYLFTSSEHTKENSHA